MILYNISLIVEDSSHDELFTWIKKHLQNISHDVKFLKMLDSPHEGTTYCIQFAAENQEALGAFQDDVLTDLQYYIAKNHTEKAFIFDSKMEYLSL